MLIFVYSQKINSRGILHNSIDVATFWILTVFGKTYFRAEMQKESYNTFIETI